MKRLIKKAFGTTLYHGTDSLALEGILSAGMIIPSESETPWTGYDSNKDTLMEIINEELQEKYPSISEQEYKELAEKEYNRRVQESVETDQTSVFLATKSQAKHYAEMLAQGSYEDEIVPVVIELDLPENSLMPDTNDSPRSKTWQESLEDSDQVRVVGNITTDYIKGVYVYSKWGEDEQYYSGLTVSQIFNK